MLIYYLICMLTMYIFFGNDRDLQGNKLTGQIPDEIGNCGALFHLYDSCLVSFIYFINYCAGVFLAIQVLIILLIF